MKKRLRELLLRRDLDGVAEMAGRKRRVLGVLISLTFDREELVVWRAVEAMGSAACRIAEDNPDYIREHLRRLYWLLSEESGGICWRAPECMAEIVRQCSRLRKTQCPQLAADLVCRQYVPIIAGLLLGLAEEDLDHFRAGTLWAIGRLGPLAGDHLREVLPAITSALDHCDPQVRGMAAWCLGQTGRAKLLAAVVQGGGAKLLADERPVDLYENGHLSRTSVGGLARRSLAE